MNLSIRTGQTLSLLTAALAVIVGAVCVSLPGCSKKAIQAPTYETFDTLQAPASVAYGAFVDARDGKRYKTVEIGGQTWMAENLNHQPPTGDTWCYNDSDSYCAKYGRLYDWETAAAVCPAGWRLPTDQEWDSLGIAAGGTLNVGYRDDVERHRLTGAGKKLKSVSGWRWYGVERNYRAGTDDYDFSALPGGQRHSTARQWWFNDIGYHSYWWTATEHSADHAYVKYADGISDDMFEDVYDKRRGLSVRCVKEDGGRNASLTARKRYGLMVTAGIGGTVSVNPRKRTYADGEMVSISAAPSCGYIFVNWTGGKFANADSAATAIIVNAGATVTANFKHVLPPVASGSFTDGRDGKTYKTVQVCKYVWMAENLNYRAPSGSLCYDDDSANCDKYGRLYNWETAMAACPAGWHLASHDEWNEIAEFARGWSVDEDCRDGPVPAKMLKAKCGWSDDGNGIDKFGFAALPGGFHGPANALRNKHINYHKLGKDGAWWAASPRDSAADRRGYATRWYMEHRSKSASSYPADVSWGCGNALGYIPPYGKKNSLSVRCVRDEYAPVKALDTVTLTVTAGPGGTVVGNIGKLRRLAGEGTTVSAVPNRGYLFDKWVGGPVENAGYAITTAVVYSDTAIAAVFKKSKTPPVNYGALIDARDGKKYNTTAIGGKTWMAENLNYRTPNGSVCHGNDNADCGKYGRLYNWKTAISACPAGWHLPTQIEWDYLCQSAGGKDDDFRWDGVGKTLKAASGWIQNGNGTDDYGFSAIAGGYNPCNSDWWDVGDCPAYKGAWWTATDRNNNTENDWRLDTDNDALSFYIDYYNDAVTKHRPNKNTELSVRCVSDEAVKFPLTLKAAAGGTVAAIPNKSLYDAGEKVTIAASPDSLHVFTRWTGGAVTGVDYDTATVTVNSAVSVTANFRKRKAPPVVYGALIDKRDGKTYKTVKIGNDTWMAENLNFQTDSSWCYNNADSNCVKYGRLYAHGAAMAACPAGWHLSTYKEWKNLTRTVGGAKDTAVRFSAGKILKARNGWGQHREYSKKLNDNVIRNANGMDDYGFSALPGGIRWVLDGDFSSVGNSGKWWTDIGGYAVLEHNRDGIYIGSGVSRVCMGRGSSSLDDDDENDENENYEHKCVDGWGMGYSVRCVLDRK